ncbi:MAG: phBC6A51 family helix-turn-helix protein [Dehalococcoidia bacterium]
MASEDVLQPSGGRKRPAKKRKMSSALTKLAQRSLDVDDDEIRTYEPTEMDLQMAEAMIGGCRTFTEIAEQIGMDPSGVSRAMKDPVRCGWLSSQLQRIVAKRIGLVDSALMGKALSGDVRAIKLYYERFGELVHRSHITTSRLDFDVTKLSDGDLDTIIAGEAAKVATDADFEVKPPDVPEGPSEAPGATPESPPAGSPETPSKEDPS